MSLFWPFKVDLHSVLNGLNHVVRLLNDRFIFKELENAEKIMFWRIRLSAIAHLQKAPITASSENVPDSQTSAYMRKYSHNFLNKTFYVLIFEKNTNYWLQFWSIFWTTERTVKICVVKTTAKMLDWCNIWPFIVIMD